MATVTTETKDCTEINKRQIFTCHNISLRIFLKMSSSSVTEAPSDIEDAANAAMADREINIPEISIYTPEKDRVARISYTALQFEYKYNQNRTLQEILENKHGNSQYLMYPQGGLCLMKCNNIQYSNVTLLAEANNDSRNFTCLLEGNSRKSAVTWNVPFENYADLKASRYLPNSMEVCNYTTVKNIRKRCIPSDWTVNQAVEFPFEPITDDRWERFPILTSSKSEHKQLFEFSKSTFTITLSFRIKNNATVYLCSSEELQPECFAAVINKTTIYLYHVQDLQKHLNCTKINKLNEDDWANLIIRYAYIDNTKVLILKTAYDERITWTSEGNAIDVRYLSVRSEEISLWKLHNYNFVLTNKTSGSVEIGKKVLSLSKNICISLNVALCSTCFMNVNVEVNGNETIFPKNEIVFSNEMENPDTREETNGTYMWKEFKIISEVTSNNLNTSKIYLAVDNTNGSTEGFWAVGNVRLCHADEIRISNLHIKEIKSKSIKCQPLLEPSVSVSQPNLTTTCPEDTKIGAYCTITCESIFGINRKHCEGNVICQSRDTDSECHCPTGSMGSTCKDECNPGTWGMGCRGKCVNCKNNKCNSITGFCKEGCEDGFVAPECTNPTTVNNISTTNTPTSITIEWNAPSSSAHKFSYNVTYKHKKYRACKNDRQDVEKYTIEEGSRKAVIGNLLPHSEYYFTIAAIFNGTQGNITNFTAPTAYTDTPDHDESLINVTVSQDKPNTFPVLLLQEPRCSNIKGPLTYEAKFHCFDRWCDDKEEQLNISYTNTFDSQKVFQQPVTTLIAYSSYTVTIKSRRTPGNENTQNTHRLQFQTKEAVPPAVTNFTAYSRNESTISLRWKAPYPPHGILERYKVTCTGINTCKPLYAQPMQCELWKNFTCADLTNLNKNTKYTVRVQAKNSVVSGYGKIDFIQDILTQENESEPPLNVKSSWDKDIVTLQWDHPFTTNGPLVTFSIEINVFKSDYLNHNSFHTNFTIVKYNRTYYKALDLKFSTVYNVTVYPINKFKGKPSQTVTINMPPPTPELLNTPTSSCIDLQCKLKIPKPANISESSYLYAIIYSNVTVQGDNNCIKQVLENSTRNGENGTEWLAIAMPLANVTDDFINIRLGDGTNTTTKYGDAINKPLQNDTTYVVTVIIANYYMNKTRFSTRYNLTLNHSDFKKRTIKLNMEANTTNVFFYGLFLILLIPVAVCGWILYNRRNKPNTDSKTLINKLRLPNCFRGSSTPSEHLPLHASDIHVQSKNLNEVDAETPLISQQYSENTQLAYKVKLENFEEYVKQSIGEDGELTRQHNLFVRGQTQPWDYGLKKQNKYKNRYNNLMAYDHSRVILEKINNDEFSDYINANYISGYNQSKAYIATQGPKPTTVCDFWRMIWQERATTIVMVANVEEDGKRKTEEYWPKLNCSLTFGSIEVYHEKSEIFSNFVFRTLKVSKGNEERTIEQLHFTSWPDHGVPLYPQTLVPFVEKVRTMRQDIAPIVVHCSAGVGRTGTIILCDYILRMAEGDGNVDFLATLQQLRDQRANLVDSPNQYILAHLVVLETLFGLDTTIPCNYELEQKIDRLIASDDLYTQMEYLKKIAWQDQTMYSSYNSIPDPANKHKNRFEDKVPGGYGRVYISRYPVSNEHSDYINAVEVDGFHIPKRFIVTQQPLPTTIADFWRMVSEKDVTTIISLNDIQPRDQSSCIFWPEKDEILDLGFAKVDFVEENEYVTHETIKLTLGPNAEPQSHEYGRNITLVKLKGWPPAQAIPENLDSLMGTWSEADKVSRGNNPIVVTCYDGVEACGIFVALSFVIEKIKLEQVCDVCMAVRTIRRSREGFVASVEQFQLLYKAAVQYLKGFDTYSNFPKDKN